MSAATAPVMLSISGTITEFNSDKPGGLGQVRVIGLLIYSTVPRIRNATWWQTVVLSK